MTPIRWAVENAGGPDAPRNVEALGGTLKLIADFGDEQLKVA
ncbi:hypothetical protein [Micromonospora sp. NBC_01813]|nr:hypothetical protein [Micromonospora sp. NBC_01813]WSA07865.1 hypothetical protein OG958_27155 [Micromonospora sp. NBC_01813]